MNSVISVPPVRKIFYLRYTSGLMYGQWGKWDGKPVDDVPRFYYDATKDGASYCESNHFLYFPH